MNIRWHIHEVPEADSTNDLARSFPAWTVVRCIEQKRGRGRFNRAWFGHKGGLWATYNVAADPRSHADWGMLPLVAGLALVRSLEHLGVDGARLRWPNDLLIGSSKLAGILVEKPAANLACIGIGVNMTNPMEALHSKTTDHPTRLADHVSPCPSVEEFTLQLAHALTETYSQFTAEGLRGLMPQLERAWKVCLPVAVETDAATYRGIFEGVTEQGSPILRLGNGTHREIAAHMINRLRELESL